MNINDRPWYYPYSSPEEKRLRDRWGAVEKERERSFFRCIHGEAEWTEYEFMIKLSNEVRSEFEKAQRESTGIDIEIYVSINGHKLKTI